MKHSSFLWFVLPSALLMLLFIALPIDVMEQETSNPAHTAGQIVTVGTGAPEGINGLASLLASAEAPAIIASDDVAKADAFAPLKDKPLVFI